MFSINKKKEKSKASKTQNNSLSSAGEFNISINHADQNIKNFKNSFMRNDHKIENGASSSLNLNENQNLNENNTNYDNNLNPHQNHYQDHNNQTNNNISSTSKIQVNEFIPTSSSNFQSQNKNLSQNQDIFYGCLTVLGTNGQRKKSDIDERQKSCFLLKQKRKGNGLRIIRDISNNRLASGLNRKNAHNQLNMQKAATLGAQKVLNQNGQKQIEPTNLNFKKFGAYENLNKLNVANTNQGSPGHQNLLPTDHAATISRTHSITYTLNRDKSIKVQYEEDPTIDMFQVGRSTENVIDMVIIDDELDDRGTISNPDIDKLSCSSTISRFACRMTAERAPPHTMRLFAGGFDENNQISLGQHAPKITSPGQSSHVNQVNRLEIDGLTTNGVLIKKPGQPWLEVSVNGNTHKLRETRSAMKAGQKEIPNNIDNSNNNILIDNTLIDLCGCMLLYRDVNYVKSIDKEKQAVEIMVENFNGERPQCPVRMSTLRINPNQQTIRRIDKKNPNNFINQMLRLQNEATWPFVYLGCGHIHSYHNWDIKNNKGRGAGSSQTSGQNGQNSRQANHSLPSSSTANQTAANISSHSNQTGNSNVNGNSHNKSDKPTKLTEQKSRTCPICRQESRFVQIKLGSEAAFLMKDSSKLWPSRENIRLQEELLMIKEGRDNRFNGCEVEDLIKFDDSDEQELKSNENNKNSNSNHNENNKKLNQHENEIINKKLEELNYIFNPCGHMTTETTAKYWSEEEYVLQGTTKRHHVCPFCLVVLTEGHKIQKLYSNVDL